MLQGVSPPGVPNRLTRTATGRRFQGTRRRPVARACHEVLCKPIATPSGHSATSAPGNDAENVSRSGATASRNSTFACCSKNVISVSSAWQRRGPASGASPCEKTSEKITIPARKVPKFTAGKALKEAVAG